MFCNNLIIFQVCKLLRHVAVSETLQVSARFTEINLKIYGPQVMKLFLIFGLTNKIF